MTWSWPPARPRLRACLPACLPARSHARVDGLNPAGFEFHPVQIDTDASQATGATGREEGECV